jgi:hypothetical protein
MRDMDDWQDKDDLDLDADDLAAMLEAGTPAEVTGPPLPARGIYVTAVRTFGARSTQTLPRPAGHANPGMRVANVTA